MLTEENSIEMDNIQFPQALEVVLSAILHQA